MIDRISMISKEQNFVSSRLPKLTEEDIDEIKGTADFLGLNMYTASLVANVASTKFLETPSYYTDIGVRTWKDPLWPQSAAKRLTVKIAAKKKYSLVLVVIFFILGGSMGFKIPSTMD